MKRRKRNKKHLSLRGCIVGVDIVVALTKKLPSEMGVAPCWQCLQIWSKLTCRETQPGKIGLRTETPFGSRLWHACIQEYFELAGIYIMK